MSVLLSCFTTAPSGPPLNFAVEVVGTSMAFSWSPPNVMQQNGYITNYTVTCTGSQPLASATTSQLQFTIDIFTPGETFQCTVYATNQHGDGPHTDTLSVTTEGKHNYGSVSKAVPVYFSFFQLFFLELWHICLFLTLGTAKFCCLPVTKEFLLL